jgi:nitric oxide synthase oxygenase domain/subunit
VPIYNGTTCIGYPTYDDENYFDRSDLDSVEPGLVAATNELTEAFSQGNVDSLVALIDPNVSIAIYLRGKYKYSLASNDYVDLSRDAIQSTQTTGFNLTTLRQRAPGVFSVSGTQTYTDHNGNSRTVYVSYGLQDFGGQWTLTQVGTAPDRVQSW